MSGMNILQSSSVSEQFPRSLSFLRFSRLTRSDSGRVVLSREEELSAGTDSIGVVGGRGVGDGSSAAGVSEAEIEDEALEDVGAHLVLVDEDRVVG